MDKKCKSSITGKNRQENEKKKEQPIIFFFTDQNIGFFLRLLLLYKRLGIQKKQYISSFSLSFHYSYSVK
jgi:hypothetical protein